MLPFNLHIVITTAIIFNLLSREMSSCDQPDLQASVKAFCVNQQYWNLNCSLQMPSLKTTSLLWENKKQPLTSYLTLVCLSLLWFPEEAADSLRADDEDLQRVVESLDLLPRLESRFLTVPFLSGFSHSLLSSSGGKVPALTTCSGLKAWHRIKLLPQVVEQPPVRRNYLIHEWTCLFIRMSGYLWHQSAL